MAVPCPVCPLGLCDCHGVPTSREPIPTDLPDPLLGTEGSSEAREAELDRLAMEWDREGRGSRAMEAFFRFDAAHGGDWNATAADARARITRLRAAAPGDAVDPAPDLDAVPRIVASIRDTHGEPGLTALADALRVEEARTRRDRVIAHCTTALDAIRQARQITEPHIGCTDGLGRQHLQFVAARLREAEMDLEREIARVERLGEA